MLSLDQKYLYGTIGANSGPNKVTLLYKKDIEFNTIWQVMWQKDHTWGQLSPSFDGSYVLIGVYDSSATNGIISRVNAATGVVELSKTLNGLGDSAAIETFPGMSTTYIIARKVNTFIM